MPETHFLNIFKLFFGYAVQLPYVSIMETESKTERIEIRAIELSLKKKAQSKAKKLNLSLTAYITQLIIKDTMKTIIILLSIVTLFACSKKEDHELSPAQKCAISNDSVNTYLQSANHWSVGADTYIFADHGGIDSVSINGVKKIYFVLDCAKTIYVGNLNETQKLLHIDYIGVNEFHFTENGVSKVALKY